MIPERIFLKKKKDKEKERTINKEVEEEEIKSIKE